MSEINTLQVDEPVILIEEKGDLEHAIRCTEQAEQRAKAPWLKKTCSYRVKMLRIQLAKRKQIERI